MNNLAQSNNTVSMNNIMVFNGEEVRTVVIDKVVWFVAKDVFDRLDIAWRPPACLESLPDEWKLTRKFRTTYGDKDTHVINLEGVFKIAFRSNKPEADAFTNKAAEVVKQVALTGSYGLENAFITKESRRAARILFDKLDVVEEENELLQAENKALEQDNQAKEAKILQFTPMVEKYKQFMDSDGLFSFGVAAKILYGISPNIGRNRLFKLLASNEYIFRNVVGEHEFWEPHQNRMRYFEIKSTVIRRSKGSYEYPQIFITPKGLEHIADKFFSDKEAV